MFKLKKAIAFLLALMMTFSCVPGSLAGDGDNQVTDTVQNKDVVLTPKEGEPEEAEKAELLELASEDLSVSPLSAQRLEELKGMIPPAGDKKGNPNGRGIKLMSRGPQPVTNTYTGFAAFEISPKEEAEAEQYDVNVRLGSPIALLETPETVIDSVTCELYHFHTDEKGSTSVDRITADSGNLNVAWENNEITGFSFSTGDFSEFVLTYTVVYHYEDKEFTCTLPGAKDIPLVQILTGLEIVSAENADEFLAGILNVEVSDADVFRLTNDEEGWKFRVLKESKEPQTLTVTQQNGRKYVITVAAAGNTELTTEDNQATISTVNGYYLPEEASAYAEILTDEQAGGAISAVQGLNGNEQAGSDAAWQAFSIGLNNVDRNEYEGFDVNVNLTEDLSGRDFRLYQVQNGQAEDITESLQLNADTRSDGSRDVHGFSFTTDEFAEYVLCYSLVTYYTTVDGATYRITLSYGRKADIPDGAELKVTEITENQENYARYVADSAARLGVSSEDVTFARFFDIEIQKDGKKIEPKAPVDVTIAYVDGMPLEGNAKLSVVHFGDEGTEVIPEVSVTDDNREITYQQGSFSVTGTIITAGSAGKHYAIIVKNGDKYYSVRTDGSLDEVEYSPETNEADIDYPLFWTYASENVDNSVTQSGNQTVNLLRMESSAAHIGDWAQPDDWYYYYIDPTVTAGITLEPALNPVPKPWDYSKAKKHHQEYHWQCALVYENNQIKSRNNNLYIGIDEDKHCIKGGASQEEAATIYLAEVKSVPNSNNLNHTVNHIDISIRGKVKLTVPLAYGDYTYVDENGETHTLHVDQDMDLELESTVPITIGDVKKAELTAFSKKTGKVLNNAFYITGYSQNTTDETDYSNPQVRIEGSFKVADLEPYGQDQLDSRLVRPANVNDQTPDNECQIINEESPKDYLQQRLDNRIYYTVTVNKDLEFPWIYKDKGTGHYGQLKNSSGLLSSKITLNLSKTFDYWDPKNECPPMYKPSFNGVTDEDMAYWRAGHILWNTSSKQGSGMDFVLDVESTSDPDVIAIEIKKKILTKSGEIIHPEEPVSNRFIVYQKTGTVRADWDSVIDVGVPGSNKAANYNDFSGIHTKSIIVGEPGEGLVNDYDIQPGMIYIEEEKDSVPSVITDTQGREWHYSDTKIETEYVWRPSPVVIPESGVHTADGFKSIPEVVGNYGTWNDNGTVKELKNRFLEFTVYNVYVPPEPVKKEVEPHAGTGLLGNVKVGQDITYEIDYYNYMDPTTTVVVKDKLDKNVKFKSAEPANLAEYDENTHTVTWTIKNAPVGEGYVRLTVEVLPGAEVPAAGHEIGSVINQGTTVKVGNDKEVTLEPVENPVPEKQETGATRNGTALEGDYKGTGLLGFVKVGDEITYKINYRNYQKDKATVTIVDTLDKNVAYVKSVPAGTYDNAEHKVTWSLAEVEAS
ncbi:MAG: hypothetical protein IKO25_04610, partial [Clostridia bacterium]|nr:hypothetical protein [Clostridia bacterium]